MSSTDTELLARLDNHEDSFTERKSEGIKAEETRKTVVAFANSLPHNRTAVLFIGVNDQGVIVGVENTDSFQKKINEHLKDCYPEIPYRQVVLERDGKHIVAVEVSHSKERPHFAGAAYIRNGSQSVKASSKIYDELIATRNSDSYEILKWKNKLVSVQTIDKKLGVTVPSANPGAQHRKVYECKITDCDAHTVSLHDLARGVDCHEPLANIILSKDTSKSDRLLLIVRALK